MSISQHTIWNRLGYEVTSGPPALSAPTNMQLNVHEFACINGTGSAMQVGIANSINPYRSGVYTLQGGVVTPIAPTGSAFSAQGYTTVAGDGLLLQAETRFGMISYSLDTPATGSPVFAYEYWNGTAWAPITPIIDKGFSAAGGGFMVFAPPFRWARGAGGYAGINASFYTLRLTATTASGVAGNLSLLQLSRVLTLRYTEAFQALQISSEIHQLLLNQGEGMVPIFETADPKNTVEYTYRTC